MHNDVFGHVLLLFDFSENSLRVDMGRVKVDIANDLISPPFFDACGDCHAPLTSYRCKLVHMVDCFKIIRAVSISVECRSCRLVYGHASGSSLKNRWWKINVTTVSDNANVFYLADSYGFAYSVHFDSTCPLLNNRCPFKSFVRTLIDRYDDERQTTGIDFNVIRFGIEFMVGKTQLVVLPLTLNRYELNNHFEDYCNRGYRLVTTFWSRHESIPNIRCDSSRCSRCFVVDGGRSLQKEHTKQRK